MNQERISKLQKQIQNLVLIKKPENIFYLLGRSFLHGYLLVKPRSSKPVFFGDGLERVDGVKTDRLKYLPLYLGKARKLELEDEFTFAEFNYIKTKFEEHKIKVNIKHIKSPVDFLRTVKSQEEIALVKKSMQIVEAVFKLVRKEIKKPAMTEIKLAQFIQKSGLSMGAENVSFPAIVASDVNAAVPHHVPSKKKIKAGESIIIDFGFKYKGYCSDFTRTVFLKKVPSRLAVAYDQVEKAYLSSMQYIEGALPGFPLKSAFKGIMAGKVYQKAVDVLAEKHLDKYFIHSLGHGTGLEIHELPNLSPSSKDILKPGMVFSIEPGVYIPRLGGIRIEDLVVLKKEGIEKFINVSTKLRDNIL